MRRCLNVIAVALIAVTTLAMQPRVWAAQRTATSAIPGQRTGKVVEVINSGGYTYVQVDAGAEKVWAAAPEVQVNVGDVVTMPRGVAMKNYHSGTLNRTFDVVYFVGGITVAGAKRTEGQLPSGHPKIGSSATTTPTPAGMSFSGIARAEGGKTVAELYAEKAGLAGKQVAVRGKVVKFNASIMGKNWMHLKDGTGVEGSDDLTVTTSATAKLGDTVLVRGMVATDKDFGYGYTYSILIEDAEVTVE